MKNQNNINVMEFPLEIFPNKLQGIINHYYDVLTIQKSYIAASLLYSLSVASGNKYNSKFSGYDVIPSLWFAIVGDVSMKKTPAISQMIKPLVEIESKNYLKYKDELAAFKKQSKENDGIDIDLPMYKRLLVNDFTTESLVKILEDNPNGVGVYSDELKQWINNFNRYSNGSDNQFWLSIFSNTTISNDRKGDVPRRVENPFVSVIGGIQPDVLNSFKGKEEDGFLQRFLFVLNEKDERGFWNESNNIDENIYNEYYSFINSIYEGGEIYEFDIESKKLLKEWQSQISNEFLFFVDYSYLGKLEIYILRLSLLLQMIWDYFEPDDKNVRTIKPETINNAIKLINYFGVTYKLCIMLMEDENKPVILLDVKSKEWYEKLDDVISTKKAKYYGVHYGLSESKVNRLLKNEKLFVKQRHGEYKKYNANEPNANNDIDKEILIDFGNPELNNIVEIYIDNREELNSKMNSIQIKELIKMIDNAREDYHDEYIIERISKTITYGYKAIYWEDRE